MASDAKAKEGRDHLDDLLGRTTKKARKARFDLPTPEPGEPSDDELLRVVDGTASSDERRRVEAAGPYTQARMEMLREALAEVGEAVPAVVRAARYVMTVAKESIEFLRGATLPLPTPAMVAVRGNPQTKPQQSFLEFRHSFASLDAEIRVEHVTRTTSPTIDLQVKLVAAGSPVGAGRVAVLKKGRVVDSMPLESDGSATFTGLAPDRYQVELRTRGEVAGSLDLEFI